MEIRLSTADGVPVYRQIVNQVKYLVSCGRMTPGQELPPIRALAERLLINPNTVVRAYSELAKDGLVVSRHGSGTYIAENSPPPPQHAVTQELAAKADALLTDATHVNLGLEDVVQLVRERHRLLPPPSTRSSV
jgi:GntR family transcriptional regulator